MDAFFNDVQSLPVKLAVIGCGCSVATEPVAEISHRWNISQVQVASFFLFDMCIGLAGNTYFKYGSGHACAFSTGPDPYIP